MNLELAMARAGISYRQYDYWNTIGLLPWGNTGSGNRRPRQIDAADATTLITMGRLVADGVTPRRAAAIARVLANGGTATIGGLVLTRQEVLA
jgi:hypothetical protein